MWHGRLAQSFMKTMHQAELNEPWQNLVFATIGEVLDEANEVCGIRVMDKTKTRTLGNGSTERRSPTYRLEVWVRTLNGRSENFRSRILEAAFDPSDGPRDREKGHNKETNYPFEFQFTPFDVTA